MTLVLPPKVRWMILCDDVLQDSRWPGKPVIVGLISLVQWPGGAEPFTLPKLTVYLVLTDGRGAGQARISCMDEASGQEVFRSGDMTISFEGKDPGGLYGVLFRLSECRFPKPGVCVVRFLFDESVIEERIVQVR
jgi:hypothetical protein